MIKDFLIGLFTHHMPTKVLSLLLSTILFLFVLDRQQDQSEIPNLRVVFRLSDEVGERWVIVGPRTVDLGGKITITGLRAKVAQAAFTLRGLPEQTKIIDAGLLTSFIRDPKQQEVTIRVDKELIKKLSVLPAGVEIKQLGPGIDSIILARRVESQRCPLGDPPLRGRVLWQQAQHLRDAGHRAEALQTLRDLLAREPRRVDASLAAARLALEARDRDSVLHDPPRGRGDPGQFFMRVNPGRPNTFFAARLVQLRDELVQLRDEPFQAVKRLGAQLL